LFAVKRDRFCHDEHSCCFEKRAEA
jgi:hypothetical protein